MIFPVAAVISFLSQFVTLEPGDIIATGTPSGVGSATGTFLKPGESSVPRSLHRHARKPGRGRRMNELIRLLRAALEQQFPPGT